MWSFIAHPWRGHILIHHMIYAPFGREAWEQGGSPLHDEKLEVEDMEAVREHMRARLEQMRRSGVALFVDGQEALPEEVVSKAVQENSPYMADYVLDAAGIIEQVRFDRVTRR